jgi:NADH dehydrogenase
MKNILILGGSGFIGRHVCEALERAGLYATVPTRRLPARSVQMLPRVSVVRADVHDAGQLSALVRGHDAVINLVAILHGNQAQFDHVHVQLPRLLAQACVAQGVRRLVHMSALGVDVNGPSMYLRSKAQGDAVLQDMASRHGLELTLLQPSVVFGADDRFINVFAQLQALAPVVPLASAQATFQPVWVQDVAQALAHALLLPTSHGKRYELVGPEVFTLAQLVQHAGQWAGHPRPIWPLPPVLAQAQAWLMEHLPGPTLMSRDNLASMQVNNVASGTCPGLSELGVSQAAHLRSVFPTRPPLNT